MKLKELLETIGSSSLHLNYPLSRKFENVLFDFGYTYNGKNGTSHTYQHPDKNVHGWTLLNDSQTHGSVSLYLSYGKYKRFDGEKGPEELRQYLKDNPDIRKQK